MVDEIKNVFSKYIKGDCLYLSDNRYIEVKRFCDLFKNIKEVSYKELVRVDDGKMGYTSFFDKCKDDGIIH